MRQSRWFDAAFWSGLASRRPSGRVLLAGIVLFALAIDFVFYTGYYASDDAQYLLGANQVVKGVDLRATVGSSRLGLTLPGAAILWLTGGEIAWVAWFHVLYHLGLVVIAFHLGRLVADERVGHLAAGLAAVQPLFYIYAGAVLPDNVLSFWLGLLLVLLEVVRQRREQWSPRTTRRWYAVAGLLIGVAYSCKETALIMTIPSAICVIAAAPRLRSTDWVRNGAWMAGGLVAFVAVEVVALWFLSGEPVWRLGFPGNLARNRELMQIQGATPWDRFAFAAQVLTTAMPLSAWALLGAGIVYALSRRRNLMLLVFFWWPALYLTIGTKRFSEYLPQSIQERYYAVALLPALVMLAIVLMRAHDRWGGMARMPAVLRGRARAVVLAALVAAIALYELDHNAPRAGTIYSASWVRGYAAAVDIARDDYPQYHVVSERFFRGPMRPLFLTGRPEWFRQYSSFPDKTPAPPFLYLERAVRAEKRRAGGLGATEPESRYGRLRMRTLRTYYPPETRWGAIRAAVGHLLGTEPLAPVPLSYPRGAISLQLVTLDLEPATHPEVFSLDRRAGVEALDNGVHHVSWGDARRGQVVDHRPPRFYVQTFDRESFRNVPDATSSHFASPVSAISVNAGYRLIRGTAVRLQVFVHGYQQDGQVISESTEIAATTKKDRVTARVELSSTAGLVAYRVRTKVIPRRNTGGLQLYPPIVLTTRVPGSD